MSADEISSYPLLLNLEGKKCVVIGGGEVATRKVRSLCDAGAEIMVVAPDVGEEIEGLAEEGVVKWFNRTYREGDFKGAVLGFACTDDASLNSRLGEAGRQEGALMNVVTGGEDSDFTVPAVFSRGRLTITVSTEGVSPALARRIKEELSYMYGQEWEKTLDFLELFREMLKSYLPDYTNRERIYRKVVRDEGIINDIQNLRDDEFKSYCHHLVTQLTGGTPDED